MAVIEIETSVYHAWDRKNERRTTDRELSYALVREWAHPRRHLMRVDHVPVEIFPADP